MDLKDRRQRSSTRGQCRKDVHYATSSMDGENCHIVSQRSYSSSKTLKAYQQDGRLRYGGCVAELVHKEKEQYVRQGESYFHCYRKYLHGNIAKSLFFSLTGRAVETPNIDTVYLHRWLISNSFYGQQYASRPPYWKGQNSIIQYLTFSFRRVNFSFFSYFI